MTSIASIAPSPRKPPRDFVSTMVAIITAVHSAARTRLGAGPGLNAAASAKGQEHDHVQREVVRVAENTADGAGQPAAFDQMDPSHVVEQRPCRDEGGAEDDERREAFDALGAIERMNHQHDDDEHLEVDLEEVLERAARPERERNAD